MADPSFDIVSKVDGQELDNALNQASKELAQKTTTTLLAEIKQAQELEQQL